MDKIEKALQRFTDKERLIVKEIFLRLKTNPAGLNIEKLKGRKGIFRIRKNDIRIIYRKTESDISVLAIERRSEKTYRNY